MPPPKRTSEQAAALRERIAREAARLLARRKVKSFHAARTRASRWLSQERLSSAEIPTQEEIARELQALTLTQEATPVAGLAWIATDTAHWLESCQPWLQVDWQAARDPHGLELCWLIARSQRDRLEQLLLRSGLRWKVTRVAPEIACYEFLRETAHRLYCVPDRWFESSEQRPTSEETPADSVSLSASSTTDERSGLKLPPIPGEFLRASEALSAWQTGEHADSEEETNRKGAESDEGELLDENQPEAEVHWSASLRPLLETLAHVEWQSPEHPEGNVLYHVLQVFELGREMHPWDEEFLWACLLHDVGVVIDPRQPGEAAERILRGLVSERVLFLIRELGAAHEFLRGEGTRKSLRKSESFDELLDLARCDREGRLPGRETPSLDAALDYLDSLNSTWDEA